MPLIAPTTKGNVDLIDCGLCYLATPYTRYRTGMPQAFRDAAKLGGRLLNLGVTLFCPIAHGHPMCHHGGADPIDVEMWERINSAIIPSCNVLIVGMLEGWDKSDGARVEIDAFVKADKPITYLHPDIVLGFFAAPEEVAFQ